MPMSSGARGLNLTAANNIIFVEPQMDVSQIAQVRFTSYFFSAKACEIDK